MVDLIDNKVELDFGTTRFRRSHIFNAHELPAEDTMHPHPLQSREDLFNVYTHAGGFWLSVLACFTLLVKSFYTADFFKIAGAFSFGISLILVYASSTMYHSLYRTNLRKRFQLLDHMMIFVLIAGSFTPFTLVPLRGPLGYSLFAIIWSLAIVGITLKARSKKDRPAVWTIYYLVMGWTGVVAIFPLASMISPSALLCLMLGGFSYTVGVIFFAWGNLKYNHGIWHLFVLTGSALHFISVYQTLF